jgi:hypothetical protein
MKQLLLGTALSALAVCPVMAADDFKALEKLSATPVAMTDTQLESVEGGLTVGNINLLNCVVAICYNSGNQFNNSFNVKKYY